MGIFFVEVETDFSESETFVLEEDDFVNATMKALDFLRELDARTQKRFTDMEITPSKIKAIQSTGARWMTEDGIQKCVDEIVVYQDDEDD